MASPRRSALLAAALLPVLAFAACGGDDDASSKSDGSTSGSSSASGTEEATTTTAATGTGSGTLKIGGKELAFDAQKCAVGGSDDQPSIAAEGKGSADGKNYTVVVKRSPSKDSVLETFQLAFSATESIVGTNFVGLGDAADGTKIKVEDKTATGTLAFTGTGGQPSGEGTFTVTCD
jgi:hypothetical protein